MMAVANGYYEKSLVLDCDNQCCYITQFKINCLFTSSWSDKNVNKQLINVNNA